MKSTDERLIFLVCGYPGPLHDRVAAVSTRPKRLKQLADIILEYRTVRPFWKGPYRFFGTVIDRSSGGPAVEYADRKLRRTERIEYALSVPDTGLRLEGIQMAAVSDYVMEDETGCGGDACPRRGLRFGPMSPAPKDILRQILQNCTDAPLGSRFFFPAIRGPRTWNRFLDCPKYIRLAGVFCCRPLCRNSYFGTLFRQAA